MSPEPVRHATVLGPPPTSTAWVSHSTSS
jgi:hypothetical protein